MDGYIRCHRNCLNVIAVFNNRWNEPQRVYMDSKQREMKDLMDKPGFLSSMQDRARFTALYTAAFYLYVDMMLEHVRRARSVTNNAG